MYAAGKLPKIVRRKMPVGTSLYLYLFPPRKFRDFASSQAHMLCVYFFTQRRQAWLGCLPVVYKRLIFFRTAPKRRQSCTRAPRSALLSCTSETQKRKTQMQGFKTQTKTQPKRKPVSKRNQNAKLDLLNINQNATKTQNARNAKRT